MAPKVDFSKPKGPVFDQIPSFAKAKRHMVAVEKILVLAGLQLGRAAHHPAREGPR